MAHSHSLTCRTATAASHITHTTHSGDNQCHLRAVRIAFAAGSLPWQLCGFPDAGAFGRIIFNNAAHAFRPAFNFPRTDSSEAGCSADPLVNGQLFLKRDSMQLTQPFINPRGTKIKLVARRSFIWNGLNLKTTRRRSSKKNIVIKVYTCYELCNFLTITAYCIPIWDNNIQLLTNSELKIINNMKVLWSYFGQLYKFIIQKFLMHKKQYLFKRIWKCFQFSTNKFSSGWSMIKNEKILRKLYVCQILRRMTLFFYQPWL